MREHNAHTESHSYCSLFLSVLRCFTSRGLLHTGVTPWVPVQAGGFPHSEISGYNGYISPPRSLSQISRVLHRHPRPRHPPCTLNVSRTETYIPQSLLLHFLHHSSRSGVDYLCSSGSLAPRNRMYSYVKCPVSPRNENRPRRGGSRLQTRGIAAYPRVRLVCNFVDTS